MARPYAKKRQADLKYRFGLSLIEYEQMLRAQSFGCAICGKPEHKKKLSVDHCHHTGKVRGLLCQMCNSGLGFFYDSIELMARALEYLKSSGLEAKTKRSKRECASKPKSASSPELPK